MTPWTAAPQAPLSSTVSWSLLKFMSIESVMPFNHLILCRPLLLLPSICPNTRVFSKELPLRIRWPKYWSFSFSISPSNEYSGLISFRIDWIDLLADQGTLKSLLQHYSLKALKVLFKPSLFIRLDKQMLSYKYFLQDHKRKHRSEEKYFDTKQNHHKSPNSSLASPYTLVGLNLQ